MIGDSRCARYAYGLDVEMGNSLVVAGPNCPCNLKGHSVEKRQWKTKKRDCCRDTDSLEERDTESLEERDTDSIEERDTDSIEERDTNSIEERDTDSLEERDMETERKKSRGTVKDMNRREEGVARVNQ